jgi:phage terminase large subunit GpA-like protein
MMQPPPNLTIDEWADIYRRLSPEASAEPGFWSTDRAPYQRGMMQAISDPTIERVVFMTGAQIGKTEIINNAVGYYIDQSPSPMLIVQPTLEMAKMWSNDRLAPMLRDTPALKDKVKDARSRDSGNTLYQKSFPGGYLAIVGANSPAGLA